MKPTSAQNDPPTAERPARVAGQGGAASPGGAANPSGAGDGRVPGAASLPSADADGGPRMSLAEHLDELRRRLVRGILGMALAFAVAYGFQDRTFEIVLRPLHQAVGWLNADMFAAYEKRIAEDPALDPELYFLEGKDGRRRLREPIDTRPQATGPGEAFLGNLKAAFYLSLFVGGPVLLWQLWLFVAAGLYPAERRAVLSYIPTSMGLFVVGTLFGYFVMVPYAIYFLNTSVDLTQVRPDFRYAQYFGFLSSLCVGLGAIFQLPVLMTALARVGLVTSATFAKWRGHFIVGSFVIGAILTPPDPFTQTMMAAPMVLLYELGILCGRLVERRAARQAAALARGAQRV